MSKYLKYLIPILFALIVGVGQLKQNKKTYTLSKNNSKVILSKNAEEELFAFYKKSQELTPKKQETKTSVSFLAVGDIMLSRSVALTINKANDPLLPFSKLISIFKNADFSFGNLESPFSGKDTFNTSGSMVFNAPKNNIKGLIENKFKILNLANNHALDQGEKGLNYTINYLTANNIKPIGANTNLNEAWQPAIVEINNISVCFIGASYASINDNGKTTNNFVARIEDTENLKLSIEKSKSICNYIVVTMHAGTEYTTKPNQSQKDFAHSAIDLGADIVIGHHPHWVQTIEKYKEKYIFYSLGNFIFDQMWSEETREGLTLKITLSKNITPHSPLLERGDENSFFPLDARGDQSIFPPLDARGGQGVISQNSHPSAQLESIELIPIIIDNYSTPRLANEDETKKILNKIGEKNTIIK